MSEIKELKRGRNSSNLLPKYYLGAAGMSLA